MAGELFGAPAGISQAIQDEGTLAQANYVRGKTAMLPSDLAHQQAQTEYLKAQAGAIPSEIAKRNADISKVPAEIMKLWSEVGENVAEAGAKEYATQEAKALKDAMLRASQGGQFATGEDGKPMSNAKSITAIGMKLLAEGFTVPAEKLLNQANLMAGHDTSQERLMFDKRTAELDQDLKIAQLVGHRTPWITNQKQLDDLNTEITRMTGKPPAWTGVPYSPETVQRLEAFALKAGDRANFQLKEEKALADQRNRDIQNSLRELDIKIREANLERQKQKDMQDKKAGVVSDASASDVDSIINLALQDNPKLKTAEGKSALDQFARSVAFDVKKMRIQNHGIDPEVARYKVFNERKSELEAVTDWKGTTTLGYSSTKLGTQAAPLQDSGDAATRKEGKWYNVKGKVLRWDPKGDPKQPWTTE